MKGDDAIWPGPKKSAMTGDKPKDEPTCRGSHDPHLSGRCWVCGGWRWEAPKGKGK